MTFLLKSKRSGQKPLCPDFLCNFRVMLNARRPPCTLILAWTHRPLIWDFSLCMLYFFSRTSLVYVLGSFPFVPPPSLVGAYLQPPAHTIFSHSDLLCNGTCSVIGGGGGGGYIAYRAQTEKGSFPFVRPSTLCAPQLQSTRGVHSVQGTNGKGIFSVCAPQYVMRPPVTEHVPLHSNSLRKNMACASGGANNMRPLSWGGGTNGKDPGKDPVLCSTPKANRYLLSFPKC